MRPGGPQRKHDGRGRCGAARVEPLRARRRRRPRLAEYRLQDGRLVLTHTEVPDALEGQGVGSRLAQGVFEALRASGRRAVPLCPFMARLAEKHPEFQAVVEK